MNLTLQKYFFQATKQYISRHCLLKPNGLTYCELHHKYSNDAGKKFTDRHEWVEIEEGIGTVGISKYAQDSLGDVVFAQLPDPGTKLTAGDECGALESVKAASEIYSPVTGIVTEKNGDVENKPSLINTSCYDEGWLFKLKLTKPEELEELMTEAKYEMFLKSDVEKEV